MKLKFFATTLLMSAAIGAATFAADPSGPPPGPGMNAPEQQNKSFSGTVQSFNYGPRGGVEGILLAADGSVTQINFAPDLGAEVTHSVTVGDQIKATVRPDNGPPGGPGGPAGMGQGPGGPRRNGRGPGNGGGGQGGPEGGPDGGRGPGGGGGPGSDAGGPPDGGPNGGPPEQHADLKPDHPVFRLVSLTDAKGKEIHSPSPEDRKAVHVEGNVKALNYDPHGVANGAQLDNGDILRIRPEDAKLLQLASGTKVTVDGVGMKLSGGNSLIDAHTVNGINVHGGGPDGPRGQGPRGQGGGPRGGPNNRGPGQDAPPPPQ